MAFNFNANQYERAFNPTKLCNWEVAKKTSVLPKRRIGKTKVIVNDRGHLLPGIRKLNPWTGAYVPTYPTTTSVCNKSDNKMGHSSEILTSWEKRSSHIPVVPDESRSLLKVTTGSRTNSRRSSINKENSPLEQEPTTPPGDPTDRSEKTIKSHSSCTDPPPPDSSKLKFTPANSETSSEPLLANAYCNGLIARNLKLHNQKHHLLADAADYSSFRKSQSSSIEAKIDTLVPAIGCKLYHSPGPTQCSKLQVFRPITTSKAAERNHENSSYDKRPKTAPRSKRLSDMDLAIYWDMSVPSLEKLTESPSEHLIIAKPCDQNQNDDNISLRLENNIEEHPLEKESSEKQPSSLPSLLAENDHSPKPIELQRTEKKQKNRSRPSSLTRKSISNLVEESSSSRKQITPTIRASKLYSSAPNLMDVGIQVNPSSFKTTARTCIACNAPPLSLRKSTNMTDEYKLAFKAGQPHTRVVDMNTLERLYKARHLRVPQPKIPYAKKSYSIRTLMPPFSVWPRAAGQDYPDHWRLASVYQHSYKPIETRKRSLMKTVFHINLITRFSQPIQGIGETEDGEIHTTNVPSSPYTSTFTNLHLEHKSIVEPSSTTKCKLPCVFNEMYSSQNNLKKISISE